jgi:hypothetical protein
MTAREQLKELCAKALARRFGASLMPPNFSNTQFESTIRATDPETGSWIEGCMSGGKKPRLLVWRNSERHG